MSGLHWLLLVDGEYADALMNFPGKINAGEGTLTGPMRLLPVSWRSGVIFHIQVP